MKTYWLLVATLLTTIGSSPSATAGDGKVRYQFQVFRLAGVFMSDTSLDQPIWEGTPEQWDKIKDEVTLFDRGEFRMGNDRLLIHHRGCFWNTTRLTFEEGLAVPLPEDRIKMIYSPNLLRREGELVRMKIESRQPFQFMSPQPGGLFQLEEISLPVGMDINIKAERTSKNVFLVSYLELELRTVNHREKLPETRLPVGRPLMDECEFKLRLRVRENKNYGILLRPKGSAGAIVIRVEIDDR